LEYGGVVAEEAEMGRPDFEKGIPLDDYRWVVLGKYSTRLWRIAFDISVFSVLSAEEAAMWGNSRAPRTATHVFWRAGN
jgi:hypothetical protein